MIQLSDLDPEAVADEVCDWIAGHIGSLTMHQLEGVGDAVLLHHRHAVLELTRYAQHGPPHCGDARPADYVQSVVEALYTSAHPDVYGSVEIAAARSDDPERAIDVVIRAALARDRIEIGHRVPVGWLATLAGVSGRRLRNLQALGEIKARDGEVTAREARRWLSGRGIQLDVAPADADTATKPASRRDAGPSS